MKERIWELADQCEGRTICECGEVGFNFEKFAELIVKECITQCSKVLVEHTGQPSVTHNYAVGLCQDRIKEHFGVKE